MKRKKRLILSPDLLPTRFPVVGTVAWIGLLKAFDAPAAIWGVGLTLIFLMWVGAALLKAKEVEWDPLTPSPNVGTEETEDIA